MSHPHPGRRRVAEIVEPARQGDRQSYGFDVFIIGLIAVNVLAMVLESVAALRELAAPAFHWIELVSVAAFTVEYLLRLWSAPELPGYERPVAGRARYAITPLLLVDLLAILPFYLPLVGVDLRFLRALRLMRIFRVVKLARYFRAMQALQTAVVSRRAELTISLALLLLVLVIASSLLYYAEHGAQPEAFSSIPAAMWWGIATLTTVGYGDVYPVTGVGRFLGAIVAMLGIAMLALPTGILGSAFLEQLEERRAAAVEDDTAAGAPARCPHCGKVIE